MVNACWGIFRESTHSPGRESDDTEILRLTGKHLEAKGFQVELKTADEVSEIDADRPPRFVFLMCERAEVLRQKLQPNLRESAFLQYFLKDIPPAFVEEYVYPYTPDQLIERIYDAPNWEYYLWLASADDNDQTYLKASGEIARAYPLYVARYGLRNVLHLLFDPGYAHTRNNARGFHKIGLQFLPVTGGVVATVVAMIYDQMRGATPVPI